VRVRVFEDYSNLDAIRQARFLVTYTCDVTPSLEQQEALRAWVEGGGRWYALHGSNSILRFLSNGLVETPAWAPHLMETLGSQFIAHPPIAPYRVEVADPEHELVRGIEAFESTDELYLSDYMAGLHVLLDTEFEGSAEGFVRDSWPRARHPVMYLRPLGQGAVLYLTLGHCRGHYDLSRFAALDVTATFSALWAGGEDTFLTELTLPRVGPERYRWTYPLQSLIDAGGRVAFGSDWNVTSPDPLQAIETAVTRGNVFDPSVPVFMPQERISLEDAIKAATLNSAYVNHLDGRTGSIEVNKLGDLVILDRNLFEIEPAEISDAKVVKTLFGGKIIFQAAENQ
jgi:type 1 glutamine amidotransferase